MKYKLQNELATNLDSITKPRLYQVVVHNDDYTPMEFVVAVLERFFFFDRRKASEVMMAAHMEGTGICGVYSKDFAETKVDQVLDHARRHEFPLVLSMEVCSVM